jgi:hypothetical protein
MTETVATNTKTFSATLEELEDYVQLLNGIFQMTNMEMTVFMYLLKASIALRGEDQTAFDPDTKKDIAKEMGREKHHFLNGYIKSLKEKGALIPKKTTGQYRINPLLNPKGESAINIELDWNL